MVHILCERAEGISFHIKWVMGHNTWIRTTCKDSPDNFDLSWIVSDGSETAPFIYWSDSFAISLSYGIQKGVFPTVWLINIFWFVFLIFLEESQDPTSFSAFLLPIWKFHRKENFLEARRKPHSVMDVIWLCAWQGLWDA